MKLEVLTPELLKELPLERRAIEILRAVTAGEGALVLVRRQRFKTRSKAISSAVEPRSHSYGPGGRPDLDT